MIKNVRTITLLLDVGLYRSQGPSLISENGRYVAHFHPIIRSCDRYSYSPMYLLNVITINSWFVSSLSLYYSIFCKEGGKRCKINFQTISNLIHMVCSRSSCSKSIGLDPSSWYYLVPSYCKKYIMSTITRVKNDTFASKK
jgi:hypothetical protein